MPDEQYTDELRHCTMMLLILRIKIVTMKTLNTGEIEEGLKEIHEISNTIPGSIWNKDKNIGDHYTQDDFDAINSLCSDEYNVHER